MHKLVLLPSLNTRQDLVSHPAEPPAERGGPVHPGEGRGPGGVRAAGPASRPLQGNAEASYGLGKTQSNVFGYLGNGHSVEGGISLEEHGLRSPDSGDLLCKVKPETGRGKADELVWAQMLSDLPK